MRRGGADDPPPFLPPHPRHRVTDGVERRGQVERDDHVPLLDREILDRRDELHARIVDEDVDAAEILVGAREHRLDLFGLGQVGAVIARLAPADRLQPLAFYLDRIGVAEAIDDDVGAVGCEGFRDAEPDARGRSGDEGGLSVEHLHLRPLLG